MPQLVSISYTPEDIDQRPRDRYARIPLLQARLIFGHGIEGDSKGCKGSRQLNVMQAEMLARLSAEGYRTGPGEMGEQLVIAGLDPEWLLPGRQLRLGEAAIVEVAFERVPCGRFARIQGKPKAAARGRVGVMMRVVTGGPIAVGDVVTPLPAGSLFPDPIDEELDPDLARE